MPAMPPDEGVTDGIVRGLYRFRAAPDGPTRHATILFSGSAYGAALEAQRMLADEWDVAAELWSATSYKALREEALSAERANRLHPSRPAVDPWVTKTLSVAQGPIVAVTDFMKAVP